MVKCSQTGKQLCTTVGKLSTFNAESITRSHLKPGSSVLADFGGTNYEVQVVGLKGIKLFTFSKCLYIIMYVESVKKSQKKKKTETETIAEDGHSEAEDIDSEAKEEEAEEEESRTKAQTAKEEALRKKTILQAAFAKV